MRSRRGILQRGRRGLLTVLVLFGLGGLTGVLAAPPAAAGDDGLLRVAHLSPDSPAVDVAIAPVPADPAATITDPGPDLAADVGYGDVGTFTALAPGSYALSFRAAGADRATPPVLSTRVDIPAGAARTVVVTGWFADLSLRVLSDDLSAPPSGAARLRVLAAAGGAEALDVSLVGGPALATALPFGGAADATVVPAGEVRLRVDGGPDAPTELPVDVAAGSVMTVLVLDGPDDGLIIRPIVDATGPAVAPSGGVDAGRGSTAGTAGPATVVALVVGGLVVAAGLRGRRSALLVSVALIASVGTPVATASTSPAPPYLGPVGWPPAAARPAADPARLTVPTAGIDTALTGVDLDRTGELAAPRDDALAGWYRQGPAPGDPGPAIVAGHVDGPGGPAVFYRLSEVAVGDPVLVERSDGTTVRFTVTSVARYPKDEFPAAAVYGPTPGAHLRLITCGGAFDRATGSYLDNIVVFAELQS